MVSVNIAGFTVLVSDYVRVLYDSNVLHTHTKFC